MDLRKSFKTTKNIFDLTQHFLSDFQQAAEAKGVHIPMKLDTTGTVSLAAPAALVAHAIQSADIPAEQGLKVLVVAHDTLTTMDEGVWLNYVSRFLGDEQTIELACTSSMPYQSNLYSCAMDIGLKKIPVITVSEARKTEWDLMVWIHPCLEKDDSEESMSLAAYLLGNGTPVVAAMYNELDAIIQSYAMSAAGYEFDWLDGSMRESPLSKSSINRFGISTSELGVEGGWGAVLTKLIPVIEHISDHDVSALLLAANLMSLEGTSEAKWGFGEMVTGVGYGQYKPVGLMGNMAVDAGTGFVLKQCFDTDRLIVLGHLPTGDARDVPTNRFQLAAWAAYVALTYRSNLTRETSKRTESINIMELSFSEGLVEAGIALARSYESIGTPECRAKAQNLYREIGGQHYMSAYACAHAALSDGDSRECERMMSIACDFNYPPALTDSALLDLQLGKTAEGKAKLNEAVAAGDIEAKFRIAEIYIQEGQVQDAMKSLRAAWVTGHQHALELAKWLCEKMLANHLGKASAIKRELKDIQDFLRKLATNHG